MLRKLLTFLCDPRFGNEHPSFKKDVKIQTSIFYVDKNAIFIIFFIGDSRSSI